MSYEVDPKDPDVPAQYSIDWHDELIGEAFREWAFEEGAFVQAQRDTGFYYECTAAGRTSTNYPNAWPRADGQTVHDGSVTWTCRHPTAANVPAVASVAWTPNGLTVDSQSETGSVASVVLSGGEDGSDYDVLCRMTPTVGPVRERTITIPVRSQ